MITLQCNKFSYLSSYLNISSFLHFHEMDLKNPLLCYKLLVFVL